MAAASHPAVRLRVGALLRSSSVGGGSWGLQIGVEGVDLVSGWFHAMTRASSTCCRANLNLLTKDRLQPGPVGPPCFCGNRLEDEHEMLTYSRSKGVFAGLTLEGAVVQEDNDSNSRYLRQGRGIPHYPCGQDFNPEERRSFCACGCRAGQQARIAELAMASSNSSPKIFEGRAEICQGRHK